MLATDPGLPPVEGEEVEPFEGTVVGGAVVGAFGVPVSNGGGGGGGGGWLGKRSVKFT